MIMFYAVYSTVMPLKNINTVMGFYIWCNFLLGVLVCLYEKEDTIFKFMLVIWGICVFGVILNYFVDYPWVGQSYEVAGTTMEVARDWTDEGFKRLPGFSRMNFVVACHILISCGYILISKRYSKLLKVFVYSLSFLAIGLSTSKTQLMQIATLPALLGTYWALKYRWPDRPLAFYYARGVVVLLVCLVVFLPLTLSTHKHMRMNGPLYGFISGDTFVERMTQMWPEAFDLLDETGNPVFGRGIGGIGTALGMGDPNPYTVNAGDNLFVYVYVEAGYFAAIPFFLGFFLGLGRLYRRNVEYFELIWVTSLCILGTAITAACAEEPTVGMLIGLLVARGYIYPNRLKQLPAPQTS
jgi:hypothetical protein